MVKTRRQPSEKERLDIIAANVKKSVAEMQAFVDSVIDKAAKGEATELEEHQAAVLATVIKGRLRQ